MNYPRIWELLDAIEECAEQTDYAPAINAYLADIRCELEKP